MLPLSVSTLIPLCDTLVGFTVFFSLLSCISFYDSICFDLLNSPWFCPPVPWRQRYQYVNVHSKYLIMIYVCVCVCARLRFHFHFFLCCCCFFCVTILKSPHHAPVIDISIFYCTLIWNKWKMSWRSLLFSFKHQEIFHWHLAVIFIALDFIFLVFVVKLGKTG